MQCAHVQALKVAEGKAEAEGEAAAERQRLQAEVAKLKQQLSTAAQDALAVAEKSLTDTYVGALDEAEAMLNTARAEAAQHEEDAKRFRTASELQEREIGELNATLATLRKDFTALQEAAAAAGSEAQNAEAAQEGDWAFNAAAEEITRLEDALFAARKAHSTERKHWLTAVKAREETISQLSVIVQQQQQQLEVAEQLEELARVEHEEECARLQAVLQLPQPPQQETGRLRGAAGKGATAPTAVAEPAAPAAAAAASEDTVAGGGWDWDGDEEWGEEEGGDAGEAAGDATEQAAMGLRADVSAEEEELGGW